VFYERKKLRFLDEIGMPHASFSFPLTIVSLSISSQVRITLSSAKGTFLCRSCAGLSSVIAGWRGSVLL